MIARIRPADANRPVAIRLVAAAHELERASRFVIRP